MHARLHTGKKEVATDVDDRLRPTGRAAGGFAALPVSWPRQDFRIANTAPSKTHRFHPFGRAARPMGTHCKVSWEINEGSLGGFATGNAKVLPRRPSTSNEIDSGPSVISSGTVMPSS